MMETRRPQKGAKASRVLACSRCYRRKIKCNRVFPCSNCVEGGSPCVPAASQNPEGHRRLAKRDLLQRLQRYESLLQQNDIPLEASRQDRSTKTSPPRDFGDEHTFLPGSMENEGSGAQPSKKLFVHLLPYVSEQIRTDEIKATYGILHMNNDNHAMSELDASSGNFTNDQTMQRAMDSLHRDKNEHLLFFAPDPRFDLTMQHPTLGQLFKLWQVYQDNIDPLLKVTHTPTLQARITDAVGDLSKIDAAFTALLFGIYSVALISLTDGDFAANFGSAHSRADLLTKYQIACQQALIRCGYLRSDDRDCLTALYLYIISIKPSVDRRSLCSVLGTVFRIAQRMEIHNESRNAKCSIFEGEMRRRLWWAMVIFDAHVCEMSNNLQSANLIPTWDCKPPSNINDFELRSEMKSRPLASNVPTQALYVALRSLVGQNLRYSDFQLAFINPILESYGPRIPATALLTEGDETAIFERAFGVNLTQNLDMDNPLHYMTIWTTRAQIAKAQLLKHCWTHSRSEAEQTDIELDAATSSALRILECEAHLTNLPNIRGFLWHVSRFYFPAYIHILKDLKKRPTQACAERAWEIMSANFRSRVEENHSRDNPVIRLFANIVLEAWEAREKALGSRGSYPPLPGIVSDVKSFLPPTSSYGLELGERELDTVLDFNLDDFLPVPMELSNQYLLDGASSKSLLGDFDLRLWDNNSSGM